VPDRLLVRFDAERPEAVGHRQRHVGAPGAVGIGPDLDVWPEDLAGQPGGGDVRGRPTT
jgi:hypothetical protein